RLEIASCPDLIHKAEPDSSLYPSFEGLQHSVRPDGWFHPEPALFDFSPLLRHILMFHFRRSCFHLSFLADSISLRSFAPPPLQRLQHYYERSDSCFIWFFVPLAMNSSPNTKQVSTLLSHNLLIIPTSTTLWIPHIALTPLISVCG